MTLKCCHCDRTFDQEEGCSWSVRGPFCNAKACLEAYLSDARDLVETTA
jgi:hypothetical protein